MELSHTPISLFRIVRVRPGRSERHERQAAETLPRPVEAW
jgi:hypothetical protein